MRVFSPADCAARVLGAEAASFPTEELWTFPEASDVSSGSSLSTKTGSMPLQFHLLLNCGESESKMLSPP
ncbi:hypothetical protein BT96DRAFT_1003866 [Gymnopus androsaceus JB14]|uniref:Uncharacterized protein n=1 Tax=Gymnopus androsaceus JB14 TaxID=1447944 RepID=A0A6A4GTS0_9AGAR|nr:hypothetical protein BT96DRAFT_1003866 [Gymnopus androsaceus JB14]